MLLCVLTMRTCAAAAVAAAVAVAVERQMSIALDMENYATDRNIG